MRTWECNVKYQVRSLWQHDFVRLSLDFCGSSAIVRPATATKWSFLALPTTRQRMSRTVSTLWSS